MSSMALMERFLNILLVVVSSPGAFLFGSFLIKSWIVLGVVKEIFCVLVLLMV